MQLCPVRKSRALVEKIITSHSLDVSSRKQGYPLYLTRHQGDSLTYNEKVTVQPTRKSDDSNKQRHSSFLRNVHNDYRVQPDTIQFPLVVLSPTVERPGREAERWATTNTACTSTSRHAVMELFNYAFRHTLAFYSQPSDTAFPKQQSEISFVAKRKTSFAYADA